jgi:hypothetical protein
MISNVSIKSISVRFGLVFILLVLLIELPQNIAMAATCMATGVGNWDNSASWSCSAVPSATDDVVLNASAVITIPDAYTAEAYNVTIDSGASLVMEGSAQLSVYGDWQNNGSFTAGSGEVQFTGAGSQGLSGGTTFNDLSVNSIEDGLVGYWKLDNDATDSSGNGLNGTLENSQAILPIILLHTLRTAIP